MGFRLVDVGKNGCENRRLGYCVNKEDAPISCCIGLFVGVYK